MPTAMRTRPNAMMRRMGLKPELSTQVLVA
jgi:hypothetical protein